MIKKSKSLTISLRGAKLKRKEHFTKEDFQRQRKVLAALEKTSQQLAIATDVQFILENIATILGKALGAKYVNFWDFTPDGKAVHIVAAYGMQKQYIEHSRKHPIPVGSAWIGRAVDTLQAWATRDITKDPRLSKEIGIWKRPVKKQDYHGLLCIPTVRGKKALGGMCIYYKDVHDFEYFEMSLATIVAYQAATAVENAKIFGELTSEKQKSDSMVKSLYDGLLVQDSEGKITAFNPRAQELLWVRQGDVFGKIPEELDAASNKLLKNIQDISSMQLMDFESREIVLKDPMKRVLEVTSVPLRDTDNRKIGTMWVLHDITEEKEGERLKTEFVAVASHQLRTPLSGLKWALNMILDKTYGPLTQEQEELLKRSLQTSEELIGLVNDLLDVSRLEEGRFDFKFEPVDLQKLAEEIISGLRSNIEKGRLDFSLEKSSEKLLVEADRSRIKMAFQNIIDNAIKYTLPGGFVRIRIATRDAGVLFSVEDSGIGIAKEDQKFIFNKFFRARNAIKLQTSGSGLGLFIVREIIRYHNGRVWFESEEGKGSIFYLQLPTKRQTKTNRRTKISK